MRLGWLSFGLLLAASAHAQYVPYPSTGGGGNVHWKAPVANVAALPPAGNSTGDARIETTGFAQYVWNGTAWTPLIAATTVYGPGSSTDKALVRWNGTTGTTIQNSTATLSDLGLLTVSNEIISSLTASTVPYLDASKQLTSSAVTPTELGYVSGVTSAIQTQLNGKVGALAAVGAVPNANGASISGATLNLQPADGTNPGVLTAGAQTIGGAKTLTGTLTLPAGTAAAPTLGFTGALTSGLFGLTNGIGVSTNGSERFRIDSSGITTWGSTTSGASQVNIVNTSDSTTGGLRLQSNNASTNGRWDFWSANSLNLTINNQNEGVRYVFGAGGGFAVSPSNTAAQAALEVRAQDTATLDSSIALISGNVKANIAAVTNFDTTNGNKSAFVFGTDNTKWDSGIIATHDTHGASYAGHMDFWVSTGGVLSKALTLGTNKQPTLPYFTSSGIVQTDASGNLTAPVLTNGQLLIGSTGAAPVAASLTAGSGISITPGAGSITIAASGSPAASYATVTASTYTTTSSSNDVFLDPATAGGSIAVTIHTAVGNGGQHINLKIISNGTVTLAPQGGQKIENDSSGVSVTATTGNLPSITIGSDNSNWWIL
jgi:hypothetical protein